VRVGIVSNDWVTGAQGTDVFLPNVRRRDGTTMLTTDTAAIGTVSIPLVAGTITNVSLKSR